MPSFTPRERAEIEAANQSGRTPVVFIHGLWLLSESWQDWRGFFEQNGYATLAPGWPGDPETAAEARQHPERFAKKSIKQITEHYAAAIAALAVKPVIMGHSFGGMFTQLLAGKGLARVAVSIDPAPYRGVLPLPLSVLKAGSPVLSNPANYGRAVTLTFEQFRYAFANVVSEAEARALFERYHVAGPGLPLFQAASANLNPWTEAAVDTKNPARGPLLIISGEFDHTVPWAIANAGYKLQKRNAGVTEIKEIKNRGHSLTIDSGWPEVAQAALAFVKQQGA